MGWCVIAGVTLAANRATTWSSTGASPEEVEAIKHAQVPEPIGMAVMPLLSGSASGGWRAA